MQFKMDELIEHNCPIEGEILIEKDKPCNWCDEFDDQIIVEAKVDNDIKR